MFCLYNLCMFDNYRAIVPEQGKGFDIGIVDTEVAELYSQCSYPVKVVSIEEAIKIVKNDLRFFIATFNNDEKELIEYLKKEIPEKNILNGTVNR